MSLRGLAKYLQRMVGPTRLELVTSAMSRRRSSQLSYGPPGSRVDYGEAGNSTNLRSVQASVEDDKTLRAIF